MTVPAEPLGPASRGDLPSADADWQRLARFFADLMLTMAEGGVDGTEAVEAVGALWHGTQDGLAARLDEETLVHGLGAVLHALSTHPEAWARLRERPAALSRVAFDEAIRWASPVQTFFRTAERDVETGGTVVPEGEKILMFLAAANGDPRAWDAPETFDLSRDPAGHVGFGFGFLRAYRLARADFVHALGSLATLAILVFLTQSGLFFLLRGTSDQTLAIASFVASLVVSPLLFLGSALLYFDQEARDNARRVPQR